MDAELLGDVMASHGSISLKFRNFIKLFLEVDDHNKEFFSH